MSTLDDPDQLVGLSWDSDGEEESTWNSQPKSTSDLTDGPSGKAASLHSAVSFWGTPQISVQPTPRAEDKTELNSHADAIMPRTTSLCCKTKLNNKARKYITKVRWLCHQVLQAAQKQMRASHLFATVECQTRKSGFFLNLLIRQTHEQAEAEAKNIAQKALLDAARESKEVYVLGYCNKPFAETNEGFSCALATCFYIGHACWEYFNDGWCTRGDSCTWQHPKVMLALNVFISKIVEDPSKSQQAESPVYVSKILEF